MKVTDLIAEGAFGRHITTIEFNDLKTIDDKIFLGLESHHEDQTCQFTFITGPSSPVVAFRLHTGSPDFQIDLLRREAQKIMNPRIEMLL